MSFDSSLCIPVSKAIELDIRFSKKKAITPDGGAALPGFGMRGDPDHIRVGDGAECFVKQAVDSGEGSVVSAGFGRASVNDIDARLAVDKVLASRFSEGRSLQHSPRFSARDVIDPIGREAVGGGDDVVQLVNHHEGPPITSKQGGGAVEA